MNHTPTPWITQEAADGAWFVWNSNGGISTKDLIMACAGRVNADHRDPKVAAADAAFIVRACNSHDELLKLVAVARRAAEMPGRDWLEGQAALCRALVELQEATGLVEAAQ